MKKVFLEKGVKNCLIVIPEDASPVEKTASEELSEYIEKSLSVKLDIVTESKAEGKCIFVGQTEYAKKANVLGKSKENWIIKMHNGNLILTGGEKKMDRGIIYATYHFLEDIVGVRWWSPHEDDVLRISELILPNDLYAEGTPALKYRKPFMHPYIDLEGIRYMARSRTNVDDEINGEVYDPEVRKYGDFTHPGRPGVAHTAADYFPKDEYFPKHPEWWAWSRIENRRLAEGGFCLSNKELQRAYIEKVTAYIEEDIKLSEETGAELPYFYSLSQSDLGDDFFCDCDECRKIIEKSGHSGYLIRFVNGIAKEIGKKYPFAKIMFSAYQLFAEPPKDDTLPEPNTIIDFAHLRGDIFHGITAKTNEKHLHYLKVWSEIARKAGCELFIWEYMYNFIKTYPAPIFKRIKEITEVYRDHGVSGIFVETQKTDTDFWQLNNFLFTHLFENPDLSEKELVHDFMMRYYGEAGELVEEYAEFLWEKSLKYLLRIYCVKDGSPFNYIDYDAAIQGSAILEKALQVVSGKGVFEERVRWLRRTMDETIFHKYFDLKRMAEHDGVKFGFEREMLRNRIVSAYREHGELPYNASRGLDFASQVSFYENFEIKDEREFDIPEELQGENPKDIYQFHMSDMPQFNSAPMARNYGHSTVKDETAACGEASKFSVDKVGGIIHPKTLRPTSKNAEIKNGVRMFIQKNDDIICDTSFYLEDIATGEYRLYKVGEASGLLDKNDVRLWMFSYGDLTINLSGMAVNFPMNLCEVYVSMKFEGESFGGSAADEDAIFIDRIIVVKKK